MPSSFITSIPAVVLLLLLGCAETDDPSFSASGTTGAIDRQALVTRHNPTIREAHPLNPLTLGNGAFAFTADVTGLQTFPDVYLAGDTSGLPGGIPLATQSNWGWHTFPNTEGYQLADAFADYDTYGRPVPYASRQQSPAGQWLRQNPHRLNLARVGFSLTKQDGAPATVADLQQTEQTLDLWTATLTSRFTLEGTPVHVQTWVHPTQDLIAVRVEAPTLEADQLGVRIAFPYGVGSYMGDPSDWTKPGRHTTEMTASEAQHVAWHRILDDDQYHVRMAWNGGASMNEEEAHTYLLTAEDLTDPLEFVVAFSEEVLPADLPSVAETQEAAGDRWPAFWEDGGAIDLSGSTDPRAHELERRIVLSQYLTAIQCAGALPPQETGLTYNSWYGKFHLEMHWWHGVHFALWNRLSMLEESLPWYQSILPKARETAQVQGYEGVRWPKMVGPDGREGPSGIGVFLIWQQPHPIYLAELVYRARPTSETLEQYADLVFETADFMASYAVRTDGDSLYVLGPPLIPAQESHAPEATYNPAFELAYWTYGLTTAQQWRERMGLDRNAAWDRVLQNLSPLPTQDGRYVNAASAPETFTDASQRVDHPTLLAPCGMLPCLRTDVDVMRRTLDDVMALWDWERTWGWDYPLVAMTAARVGRPNVAVDALLMDVTKNTYLVNGHNYQRENLTIYLPGNGGLLAAVAMMAAGWDGAPDVHAPGFPQDGTWTVRWEGLKPMP